jgi:hypothetical protein
MRVDGLGRGYRSSSINLAWKMRSPVSEYSFDERVESAGGILGNLLVESSRLSMEGVVF